MRAPTARDALRPLVHPRQIKIPATARNDSCVAAAVFGAGGKFGAAEDVALSRGVQMLQLLVPHYVLFRTEQITTRLWLDVGP